MKLNRSGKIWTPFFVELGRVGVSPAALSILAIQKATFSNILVKFSRKETMYYLGWKGNSLWIPATRDRQKCIIASHFVMIIKMRFFLFLICSSPISFKPNDATESLTTAKQALSACACACLSKSMSTYVQTCWTFRLIFVISQSLSIKGRS